MGDQGLATLSLGDERLNKRAQTILSIPLSTLKRGKVQIKELPKEVKEAMEHFDMGLQTKVILTFPKPFWKDCEADYINIIDATTGADPITSFLNLYKLSGGKTNTLMVSFYADNARSSLNGGKERQDVDQKESRENKESTEEKSFQEKLIAQAMATLAKTYPDMPKPTFTYVTSWDADPFTYGSWTTTTSKTKQSDYDALRQSAFGGKLVFAGDYYTLGLTGNVHTAHLSGKAAKAKIDEYFYGLCLDVSSASGKKAGAT
jgi:hypothetical protein